MATPLSRLALLQPRSLDDALRLLRDEGPLVPLAGCTDLYVGLHFGTVPGQRFLDLQGLRALRGIRVRGDTLVIGALATYTELIRVAPRAPPAADPGRGVAGRSAARRSRTAGTLGGNVANASPAGDTLPVLAVAEATVVLRSADGERRVPFDAFYTGYRQTAMRPDELIVAIEVPPVEGRQWFRKVGTRAAQAISKVVMAAVRAPHPRIALGSVAPTVVRVPRTEAVLAAGGTARRGAGRPDGRDPARSTTCARRPPTGAACRRTCSRSSGATPDGAPPIDRERFRSDLDAFVDQDLSGVAEHRPERGSPDTSVVIDLERIDASSLPGEVAVSASHPGRAGGGPPRHHGHRRESATRGAPAKGRCDLHAAAARRQGRPRVRKDLRRDRGPGPQGQGASAIHSPIAATAR